MNQVKDTARAAVRIGYDGRVYKTFRGPNAGVRFANEVRILQYLEERGCPFVPRLLFHDPAVLLLVTTNCGSRVEHMDEARVAALFGELEAFGVRHDDAFLRNITYSPQLGRFCLIDFEFATLLDEAVVGSAPAAAGLVWSGLTHAGKVRPNNEDAFLALSFDAYDVRFLGKTGSASLVDSDFVFAVSDGMGGAGSGEFASRIAVDKITGLLPHRFRQQGSGPLPDFQTVLPELFAAIHRDLTILARSYPECAGMGATLTLAWFAPGWLYFAHIGDSRLYSLPASGALTQLSEDHSQVGWLRRQGKLTEREARSHPRRHILNKALGGGHQYVEPQVGAVACQPGDRFLLATDGVIDGLWDHQLEAILSQPDPGKAPAQQLIDEALERSGRDNITALVVEIRGT
jgi:PPM family protein phosphatase